MFYRNPLFLVLFLFLCLSLIAAAPPGIIPESPPKLVTLHIAEKVVVKEEAVTPANVIPKELPAKPNTTKPKSVDLLSNELKTEDIGKIKWHEIKTNKTLQGFQKTLMNESIVPFLKKCYTIDDKHLPPNPDKYDELLLCPVYFDNLLRLNQSSVAGSINSADLEDFIKEVKNNKSFCRDYFAKYVNSTFSNFEYSGTLKQLFENMSRACYILCYEPTPAGPLKDSNSCQAIAFMGMKLKNEVGTEKMDSATTKPPEEDADPNLNEGKWNYFCLFYININSILFQKPIITTVLC